MPQGELCLTPFGEIDVEWMASNKPDSHIVQVCGLREYAAPTIELALPLWLAALNWDSTVLGRWYGWRDCVET